MKHYFLALSVVLFASVTTLASAEIYKWTDEKGQLHYTERPAPPGKSAENIGNKIRWAASLPVRPGSMSASDSSTKTSMSSDDKQDPDETKDKTADTDPSIDTPEAYKEKLKNYCSQQSNNLNTLKTDSPIAWEENGETILLSSDEKKQKIESIKTSIEKNCSSVSKE